MKKTIAGYFDKDKNWIDQKDVEMGQLETICIESDWAIGNHAMKRPQAITADQKLEILIDDARGKEYLNAALLKYDLDMVDWKNKHDSLVDIMQKNYENYNNKISEMPEGTLTC